MRNLDFWTYNGEKTELSSNDNSNMFNKLKDSLFNKSDEDIKDFEKGIPFPKHSYIAFLKQSNVVKHISKKPIKAHKGDE